MQCITYLFLSEDDAVSKKKNTLYKLIRMNIIKKRDRTLSQIISRILEDNSIIKTGIEAVKVKEAYKQAAGEMVNKYTRNIYFKDGTLNVSISSAPLRSELRLNKEKFLAKINRILGEDSVVKDIRLK
jgi:hypothetical protein